MLRPGVLQEDVEHQVLGRDPGLELAIQLEADRLRDLHLGEALVDQVGVLGGPHAPGQGIVDPAHAGVAVGRLDEVARIDEMLAGHLVADAGGDAVLRREVAHARVGLERVLELAQGLDLGEEGAHLRHLVGVDEVILEDRELVRVLDLIIRPVFLFQEVVDLRRGELVRVAAVHLDHDRVARLDIVGTVAAADQMVRQDLLRHGHRPRAGVRLRQLDLPGGERLGEGEQAALADDDPGDRVVPVEELFERNPLPRLQPLQLAVVPHQDALADVVAGVDGGERGGDGEADAGPLLRLHGGLARAADPLAVAGDDDLEVAVLQGVALEQALAVDDQSGVGIAGDVLRPVAEADPRRGHRVRIDVVEEIVHRQVVHPEVQLAAELAADQLRILGQEEDPLAGGQADDLGWLHAGTLLSREGTGTRRRVTGG